MHEFAPSKSSSGNCPSDAELAAYIDGVLGKAEADRVTRHLASCERCYEVYAETVDFQLEAGKVVQFPSDRWKDRAPRWLAAAAASLIAVAGGWFAYQSFLAPPPQMMVAEITPDLGPVSGGRPVQELLWDYNKYRGSGTSDSEYARQSFQVGALLVDFRLSAQSRAAATASEIWRKVGVVVGDTPGLDELSQRIFSEANQISPEENPAGALEALRSLNAQAARTEDELEDSLVYPEYFDFGKWTEAGRIAAITQDSSFFRERRNRRFLSFALRAWSPEKPEKVQQELRAIEEAWKRDLDTSTFMALEQHFQRILDQFDFRP